tara:strand:+ start:39 stop:1583 length:1545 start_codon:yes stop_codon:yes gene_type:complete
MKNLVIHSNNNEFIINLFNEEFNKKNNFVIKSIISANDQMENLNKKFQNTDTKIFNYLDFEKSNIENIDKINNNELDEKILKKYAHIEILSYKMMDFYNTNGDKFSLRELRQAYYNQLVFTLNFIEKFSPDIIFFTNVPHSFSSLLLGLVAEMNKIKIVFKREISIPGKFIFQDNFFDRCVLENLDEEKYPLKIRKKNIDFFNQYKEQIVNNNIKEIDKFFSPMRDHFLKNNEHLIKKYNKFFLIYFFLRQIFFHLPTIIYYYFFKNYIIEDSYKIKGKLFKDSVMSLSYQKFELLKADFRKYKLLTKYISLTEKIDLKKKYIYFALHYQPEATTYPFGNYFIDQINAIKLLSTNLPEDVFIYIKEHPDTFGIGRQSWVIGDYSRDLNYYNELKLIKNVVLIPLKCNSLTLIKNSLCISTISGSVGLEAVFGGKPAIVFGNPWYTDCEGVLITRTHDECKMTISSVLKNNSVDKLKVNIFLQKASCSVFDYKDDIDYVSTKLIEKIDKKKNQLT